MYDSWSKMFVGNNAGCSDVFFFDDGIGGVAG